MSEEILKVIDALTEKLGATGDHLWEILVGQALVSGITDVLICILLITVGVVSLKFVKKKTSGGDAAEWTGEAVGFAWSVWSISTFIIMLMVIVSGSGAITALFNPEYWALTHIIGLPG